MIRRLSFIALLFLLPTASFCEPRYTWTMDEKYEGAHYDLYNELKYKIPILMRQTLIDIAGRTGLNFQDGWDHPMTVGFTDEAPGGAENVLAYVQMFQTEAGIEQELRVNLTAYSKEKFNFEKVFAHELTHAMVNDALGGSAAAVIPVWFQEGLAVYSADQGEKMVKSYVYANSGFAVERILNGLDNPEHRALDYAEDYLAFRYIYEEYSSNGLHFFVQEVIKRKGDIASALDYSLHETWGLFQKNAREFAVQKIKEIGPAKRGEYESPY